MSMLPSVDCICTSVFPIRLIVSTSADTNISPPTGCVKFTVDVVVREPVSTVPTLSTVAHMVPLTPSPPRTCNAPESTEPDPVVSLKMEMPVPTLIAFPIYTFPPIPTPPATCSAPDAVLVDEVVAVNLDDDPPTFIFPPTPMPPATMSAPDAVLVDAVVDVIFTAPVEVNPIAFIAPDTPTPPDTTSAPDAVLVDAVVDVIFTLVPLISTVPDTDVIFTFVFPVTVVIPELFNEMVATFAFT